MVKLFASKQPDLLRSRLTELEQQHTLKKVPKEVFMRQSLEILCALESMGEELSAQERRFVDSNITEAMKKFVAVNGDMEGAGKRRLLSTADRQIHEGQGKP